MRKLQCSTLTEALKDMKLSETCIAPDGYSPCTVMKACSELNRKGYVYRTSTSTGVQIITRLK